MKIQRLVIMYVAVLLALPVLGNTLTWTGGGANANWNASANWGGVGSPANGDTLIFQGAGGLMNTNNIANLTLNQIRFYGYSGGFDLHGNAFTLTNGIICTNVVTGDTIENNITLATADALISVPSAFLILTLSGQISGSVGVNKTGLGGLIYQYVAGDNTYTGTTLVSGGTLQLNVGGTNAFRGPLVIGDGTGTGNPKVQLLQLYEISDTVPITINQAGSLDLNNNAEIIGTNLSFSGIPCSIYTGTGLLTLMPNCTITVATNATVSIYGNLNTGSGTLTIQGADDSFYHNSGYCGFEANVSGSANIPLVDRLISHKVA